MRGGSHAPAYDAVTEGIQHIGDVAEAAPGRHVGQISHPEAIWRWRRELPLHQIARPLLNLGGNRGPLGRAPCHAGKTQIGHEACNTVTPPRKLLTLHLPPDFADAIHAKAALVHPADLGFQLLITDGPGRWLSRHGCVVRRWGDLQRRVNRLDPEALSVCGDERRHLSRRPSSSVAKKIDAAFKMSFARRRSRTSRSSSAIGAASGLEVPGR